MNKTFLALAAASACWATALADGAPLWLRNTAISPDGQSIAFTYRGNIFVVDSKGGQARQLTASKGYDSYPVWSPDGKLIAFGSDRDGSIDIFVVDAAGGTPRRITTNSGQERPLAFLNDSTILFSANLEPARQAAQMGAQSQVYQVSTNGGRPKMFASVTMGAMSVDPQGRVLYQDKKGYENEWRKHERSAGTSDIWLISDGKYTKLTDFDGHDLNPLWQPSGQGFWYLSEQDGSLNVHSRSLDGKDTQLTKFERHPVRSLSASNNGVLAFSWDGEIYTLRPGQQPQHLDVTIIADDYDSDLKKGYRSSGATAMAVSPNGDEVAFVMRGDVYVTSTEYETTKRITNTDGQERVLSFSDDGRSLVYDSERDGKWQLFLAKIKNDDEKSFAYATDIEETLLYSSDRPAQQPAFSPDGKKVAFLEGRDEVRVIDVKTKQVNTALDGKYNYSYTDGDISFQWSPDSRWLLASYIGNGGWNNSDVALVKADGCEVIDLTESGYADNGPQWALDGKGITYASGRYGYKSHGSWGEENDVILMVLDPEAWDVFNMSKEETELKEKKDQEEKEAEEKKAEEKKSKKDKKKKGEAEDEDAVKPLNFDLQNRFYRTRRLTSASTHLASYYMNKKGDKLYYIAYSPDGEMDLYARDLKKGDTQVLAKSIGPAEMIADKDEANLYLLSGSGIKKVSIPDGEVKGIEFNAPFSRQPSAERAYIYDHAWQQVKDKFYDANIHGIDWEQYGQDYRKFLPYISNNYDFAILLSELLGELNASHTGAGYRAPGAEMSVGRLGAFFDEDYEGDGLLVAEVIARGPLSAKKANVEAGDIIVSIDGEPILAGQDYFPLLEGKSGKKVRIGVKKPNGKVEYGEVKPISSTSDLLYQRWVEHNEHVVDSVSGGRVGYVHVEGMDSESFRNVYSKLLGKYRNCDAVVVDTRYNGGGWLHNDIALLLSGKEYVRYSPRGKYIGSDPFSQWTKPSVMLVNESNYSDAHGTPYVYQTLGIGDVVGAPVPGTMTAVWWETQIDPTLHFGIPQVTSLDRNGQPLENHQLQPDLPVYNNPGDVSLGIDTQLIQATKHVMTKIK